MTNWKKYKIANKEKGFVNEINFELDDYVKYEGGKVHYCYIFCVDTFPYNTLGIGDWLEIDTDRVRNYEAEHYFNDTSMVRKYGSSNEVASGNNNNSSLISQNQAGVAIQMVNKAIDSDERNRYTASMEINPKTGNITYRLSGERK